MSQEIRSKLEQFRNAIGIYVIAGIVLFFIGIYILTDGFDYAPEVNSFFWLAVVLIGALFYFSAGGFLSNPEQNILNSLQNYMYLFILSWIAALFVTLAVFDVIALDTFLGVLLSFGATLLMNQFITTGKQYLNPSTQQQQHSGVAGSSHGPDRITQLERLSNLRERGAISEDEYQKEKALVMQKYK